jgi:hypothetical protein
MSMEDNKAVLWVAVDNLGMLRQLGVMPGAPS